MRTEEIPTWPEHPQEAEPMETKEQGPARGDQDGKADMQPNDEVSDQEVIKLLQAA